MENYHPAPPEVLTAFAVGLSLTYLILSLFENKSRKKIEFIGKLGLSTIGGVVAGAIGLAMASAH